PTGRRVVAIGRAQCQTGVDTDRARCAESGAPGSAERHGDAARRAWLEAVVRLAGDVLDPDAVDRGRDQTAPERMVDLRHRGVCDDEWAEGAGRRDDLGSSVLEVLEPGLEPDGAECAAEPLEPPARVLRRLDPRGGGQRAAEL